MHLPGHIHYLMGNYAQAHKQFSKAKQADTRYMASYGIVACLHLELPAQFQFVDLLTGPGENYNKKR